MASTVPTFGIGRAGGLAATMGYGLSVMFTPLLPGKACVLVGTDPSVKRLVGADPSVKRLVGTDPSVKRLVGRPECR